MSGAFALPFSDLGAPRVFIDGRFFVLGFGGLTIALLGMVPVRASGGGALRGRGKRVALAGGAAFLAAICGATWGLILLLGRYGYFLHF